MAKQNAGTWSELYTFMKVLADKKLYAADSKIKKIPNRYMPVMSVIMQKQSDNSNLAFVVNSSTNSIEVYEEESTQPTLILPSSEFEKQANDFFKIISTRKGETHKGTFDVPEIEPFFKKILNPKLKKNKQAKSDIFIVVHDTITNSDNEVGFSIKSKYKEPATLLNASGQTVFRYEITNGSDLGENQLKSSLALFEDDGTTKRGPTVRIKSLLELGAKLEFSRIKGNVFSENVSLIDSQLDKLLAEALLIFINTEYTTVSDVIEMVSKKNPCGYKASDERLVDFYSYKMKRLLVDSALGMLPGKPWDGKFDVSGGYLIVKEQGEILCYHLFNLNDLQSYLYENTKFEGPASSGRGTKKSYAWAQYVKEGTQYFVDITLQIRFK